MKASVRNNVKIIGKGTTPMVFAHGYGCDHNMWRYITPAFEEDYKVILFDHVGFGSSDTSEYSPERYNSLSAYADDLLEICEELQLENVIYVGHSVSAMIGALAAVKKPEFFSKLILIGPSPCYLNKDDYKGGFTEETIMDMLENLDGDYLGWADAITPVIMGNPDRPELTEELAGSFCNSNEKIAKDFARVMFLSDNRKDLSKLTVDTLVLQCNEDAIAPLQVGQFVHEQVRDSKLKVMEATGHCPNLSAPEETVALMKEFLRSEVLQ